MHDLRKLNKSKGNNPQIVNFKQTKELQYH